MHCQGRCIVKKGLKIICPDYSRASKSRTIGHISSGKTSCVRRGGLQTCRGSPGLENYYRLDGTGILCRFHKCVTGNYIFKVSDDYLCIVIPGKGFQEIYFCEIRFVTEAYKLCKPEMSCDRRIHNGSAQCP